MPPEERRKERIDLADKVNCLDKKVAVLTSEIKIWLEANKEEKKDTIEYRKSLDLKIEEIKTGFNNLPCETREIAHVGRIKLLEEFKIKTENRMERILIYIFLGLFSAGVLYGTLTKTVFVNTNRIDNLEAIHPRGK